MVVSGTLRRGRTVAQNPTAQPGTSAAPYEGKKKRKGVYDTGYSQAVTHPSTNPAQRCLTSVIGRERVFSTWYGRKQFQRTDKYPEPLKSRNTCQKRTQHPGFPRGHPP